ncbi:MAG: GNAT family N-acetyltransferase [Mycobacterium sp.]
MTNGAYSEAPPGRFLKAADWPSLADQIEVAADLFGSDGDRLVAGWLDGEVAKVDDPAYVRLFTEHVSLPGVAPVDYAHRLVRTSRGALLGGIRFYGRDLGRPFVEIVAHDFDDAEALRACVRGEWSTFAVCFARLRARPGRITGPDVLLDKSIHAARYRDMRPSDGRVTLGPFDAAEEAVTLVRRRYDRVTAEQVDLARNLKPADPDDLDRWHEAGQLDAIRLSGKAIGVLAIAPGRVGWIEGDEINEEVIDAHHRGHGYATSAQTTLAARAETRRERFLVGTIDRYNEPSRRTAERAGRPRLLDDMFLRL